MATAAAALEASLFAHYSAVAGVALLLGWAATRPLLRTPTARPSQLGLVRPSRHLLAVGAVAFCAFLIDGAATNWIAVHLRSQHDAGQGLAAAGYLLFTAAVVLGRLRGDWLTARLHRTRLAQACGMVTAVGTAVAILAPSLPVALAGWVLIGLGVAPLAPIVLGAAPHVGAIPAPAAIATVTTIGYLGSFTGPPLIGALAEPLGLPTALALIGAAGSLAALLARALTATTDTPTGPNGPESSRAR